MQAWIYLLSFRDQPEAPRDRKGLQFKVGVKHRGPHRFMTPPWYTVGNGNGQIEGNPGFIRLGSSSKNQFVAIVEQAVHQFPPLRRWLPKQRSCADNLREVWGISLLGLL